MVTNQLLRVDFGYGVITATLQGREVRLNDILDAANNLRTQRNLPTVTVTNHLRSRGFIESVFAAEMKLGLRAIGDYSGIVASYKEDGGVRNYAQITSPLLRSSAGRTGGTFVHSYIAIDTAASLDKQLAMDMYELLTTSPIFQLRNDGGDLYKGLYEAVFKLAGPEGRAPAKAQLLARVIAARAGVPIRTDNATWNYATAEQLHVRHELQAALMYVLNTGLVRNFQTLLELAACNPPATLPNLPPVDINEVVKDKIAVLNYFEDQVATGYRQPIPAML